MVAEAETLALGNDWRGGVNRFRALLDEWKALPRIDRATDDALWHRFSAARTTYTRRRKAQFAEQAAKRDSAKAAKEQIIAEARELANSTEWGPTAGAFRDLMTRWKAAGAAPREIDDAAVGGVPRHPGRFLQRTHRRAERAGRRVQGRTWTPSWRCWTRPRPTCCPVTDLAAARAGFRTFLEKYNAYGRVPREQMRSAGRPAEGARDGRPHGRGGRVAPHRPAGPRPRRGDGRRCSSAEIDKLTEKAAKATARGDQSAAAKATRIDRDLPDLARPGPGDAGGLQPLTEPRGHRAHLSVTGGLAHRPSRGDRTADAGRISSAAGRRRRRRGPSGWRRSGAPDAWGRWSRR